MIRRNMILRELLAPMDRLKEYLQFFEEIRLTLDSNCEEQGKQQTKRICVHRL